MCNEQYTNNDALFDLDINKLRFNNDMINCFPTPHVLPEYSKFVVDYLLEAPNPKILS